MTRLGKEMLSFGLLGLCAGTTLANHWTRVFAGAAGLPDHYSTDILLALAAALLVAALVLLRTRLDLSRLYFALLSAVSGLAAYTACSGLALVLRSASYPSWTIPALIAAALAASAVFRVLPPLALGLAVLVALPEPQTASGIWGTPLARIAAADGTFRFMPYAISVVGSAAVLLSLCFWIDALLFSRPMWRALGRGAAAGALAGTGVAALHVLAFTCALKTGFSAIVMTAVLGIAAASLAVASHIAQRVLQDPGSSRLLRLAPAGPLLAVVVYVGVAFYGGSSFFSLAKLHSDTTYAYIHIASDTSWSRTLDAGQSLTKESRIRQFLSAYPHSAYRARALRLLTETSYVNWHFKEAYAALAALSRDYPSLRHRYSHLEQPVAFACGHYAEVVSMANRSTPNASAHLASLAAARLGDDRKARRLQADYTRYLAARSPTAWMPAALTQASAEPLPSSDPDLPGSRVEVRITGAQVPVRGLRVVLVQPRIDAADLANTRRFTGARTLPGWNACWSVTDGDGVATIENVPEGSYELVLGLPFRSAFLRSTVVPARCRVEVSGQLTRLPDIRIVPSIRQVHPKPDSVLEEPVRLKWEQYPNAAAYSVTVMRLNRFSSWPNAPVQPDRGATCWARSGIRGAEVVISPDGFVNGVQRLQEGERYAWIVYAHDKSGAIISSSEHYFLMREPTFTLRGTPGRPPHPIHYEKEVSRDEETAWLHTHRAAGCDSDHRDPGCNALSGLRQGPRSRAHSQLPIQSQTDRRFDQDVSDGLGRYVPDQSDEDGKERLDLNANRSPFAA